MIENAIDVTERCRHCLMCRHVCPVGNITRMETLTPHGWAQLVALERRGLSTWNKETVDALYWMISGGVVPGGSCLKMVWETAVS